MSVQTCYPFAGTIRIEFDEAKSKYYIVKWLCDTAGTHHQKYLKKKDAEARVVELEKEAKQGPLYAEET